MESKEEEVRLPAIKSDPKLELEMLEKKKQKIRIGGWTITVIFLVILLLSLVLMFVFFGKKVNQAEAKPRNLPITPPNDLVPETALPEGLENADVRPSEWVQEITNNSSQDPNPVDRKKSLVESAPLPSLRAAPATKPALSSTRKSRMESLLDQYSQAKIEEPVVAKVASPSPATQSPGQNFDDFILSYGGL